MNLRHAFFRSTPMVGLRPTLAPKVAAESLGAAPRRLGRLLGLLPWLMMGHGLALADPLPAPPLKPGLWQVHTERSIDGKPAPDMGAQFQRMPPEARKRMEANMRQHGVQMLGEGNMRMCLTRESLGQGRWQGQQERCKTELSARNGNTWTWKSTCSQPPVQSEGEATFQSPEAYTVKVNSTMQFQGRTQTSKMSLTGKWQGADCGDLQPLAPPAKPGAKP